MISFLIRNTSKCELISHHVNCRLQTTRRDLARTTVHSFTKTDVNVSSPLKNVGNVDVGMPQLDISNISVYKTKTVTELIRALLVLKISSYSAVSKHGLKLMHIGQTILGRRLFNQVMRWTFYGQFVGGQTDEQINEAVLRLKISGLKPLLCIPVEEALVSERNNDAIYDDNTQKILHCIDRAVSLDQPSPTSQLKLTALIPVDLCETLSRVVPDPYADDYRAVHAVVSYLNGQSLHIDGLNDHDTAVLARGIDRVRNVCERIMSENVRLLVDAEYTSMNPALRLVTLATMLVYNKQRPLVSYTYQNYLKQTYQELKDDIDMIRKHDACFGAKLVRGAYIVQERQRAQLNQYPDPVHDTFADTSRMYNMSVELLLDNIREDPDRFYVIIATHNKESVQHAINGMLNRNISKTCDSINFGQLYGMDDSLSSALGQSRYQVYKSIPLGSVEETIPYLYRRAVENSTFLASQQQRAIPDRKLLWKSLIDRTTHGFFPRNKSIS